MIRLTVPDLNYEEVKDDIKKIIDSGWLTNGPYVKKFEQSVKDYLGVKHAIAVSSGTTALHLTLAALDIKKGDEVIVPDYTFPATGNTVTYQGARPVLTDINLNTFNIDVDDIINKLTNHTKVIMPVHQFGLPADITKIKELHSDIPIIEDAACAIGAKHNNKFCGTLGSAACFSFHPRKVITTGEGGMVTTDDKEIADNCFLLRNHGQNNNQQFIKAGFNYRLSEISAAIGISQMKKLDSIIKRRISLAKQMIESISSKDVTLPVIKENIFQSFVILVKKDRDKIIAKLRDEGVEATTGAAAMHVQPFYQESYSYKDGDLKNSFDAYKNSITLPLYPSMKESDVENITEKLNSILR